jgi:hypothetical protein
MIPKNRTFEQGRYSFFGIIQVAQVAMWILGRPGVSPDVILLAEPRKLDSDDTVT